MQPNHRYLGKWTLFCGFGELSGIAVAGLIAFFVNNAIGEPQTFPQKLTVLISMLAAGAIEGTLLGFFQWKVLRRLINISKREWVGITITVAVLGWLLGMLPSLFFVSQGETPSNETNIDLFNNPILFGALCLGVGFILGAIFGWFQFLVLRKYSSAAAWWILANALGWGAGIGWIYLGASLPDENSGLWLNIVAGASGGVLAGVTVGLITGLFLGKITKGIRHPGYMPASK